MTAALQEVVIEKKLPEIVVETGPDSPNKEVESSIHIWILDSTEDSEEDAEVIIEEEQQKRKVGIDFPQVVIDTHAWKTLPGGKQVMVRTGSPGELSGNDMRKIDIAVKAALADSDPEQLFRIRGKLVESYMTKENREGMQGSTLIYGTSTWVSSPSRPAAVNMAISNNVMKGRSRHEGLSPNQLKEAKLFEKNNDPFPKPDMLKAVNVMATFNRNMAREKFGDKPFTVYRGVYGEQAKAIKAKAKKGDTIRINANTLTSFTTDLNVAKKFMTSKDVKGTGIVIQSKVSYKNVFDSWASNKSLSGRYKEGEVIVSPKGMKMTGVIIDD